MRIDGSAFTVMQPRAAQAFAADVTFTPPSIGKMTDPAKSAVLNSTGAARSDQLIETQRMSESEEAAPASGAREAFLRYAQQSPMERMREQILKSLGMTEESLKDLPLDERALVEEKIRKMIEEKMREAAEHASGARSISVVA